MMSAVRTLLPAYAGFFFSHPLSASLSSSSPLHFFFFFFFTLEFRRMAFISKAHLISADDAPYVDHHHL